jgi:hypothetical protein
MADPDVVGRYEQYSSVLVVSSRQATLLLTRMERLSVRVSSPCPPHTTQCGASGVAPIRGELLQGRILIYCRSDQKYHGHLLLNLLNLVLIYFNMALLNDIRGRLALITGASGG